jgi:nucleotide-binding universal stress UspA family protein
MTEWRDELAGGRIVVALDDAALAEWTLRLAIKLASALRAELSGLFVEDVDLLRLAGLPIAKESGFAMPAPRRVAPADVERALRLQAQQVRRLLEEAAVRVRIQWSFQVTRGRVWDAALARAGERDLVLLARRSLGQTAGAVSGEEAPRAVLALFDGEAAAYRALGAAAHLAHATRCGLGVLIPAENSQAFQHLREEADRWLEERGWKAEGCQRIPAALATTLALATRERRSAALVAPGNAVAGEGTLREWLRAIPCPMLVVP